MPSVRASESACHKMATIVATSMHELAEWLDQLESRYATIRPSSPVHVVVGQEWVWVAPTDVLASWTPVNNSG